MPSNEQRREAAKRKLERQLANRAERARKRRIIGVVSTVVGVVAVVGLVYWLANIGDDPMASPAAQTSQPNTSPETPATIPTDLAAAPKRPTPLPAEVNCEYPADSGKPASKPVQAPPSASISAEGTVDATIATSAGNVKVTLDRALAPCTVNSFLSLAKQGYFNDTTCHRMTTTESLQVLQCGDPTATGSGGPGYTFDDEVFPELKYGRGILAMANAGKNPATNKGTNGSQFFIVYGNAELPPDYSAFGTISAEDLQVVDSIAKAGHDGSMNPSPGGGKPVRPVVITDVAVAS
ncbi:peptidylprolyl isomerase [Actinokineospora iranica]|uniref:Peptidyl-prolyl cis-trans isomerase B (Cyclophilin B) n=1 Tax=Actinokineospora iranica TaxID=1271860 RepID=A0A1G6KP80_9PSEU|nr:peptidylprolyl isomerase [Actinokineospora iranica]SDC32345.1 peptidyl-prolyl cis-trans isomerase B (cyclophilin B) [Actinokineospora iranica]